MAAPTVFFKLVKRLYKLCSQGVQMNITDRFLKISVFFTDDRFVAVLKKMAMAKMSAIVENHLTRKKSSHIGR